MRKLPLVILLIVATSFSKYNSNNVDGLNVIFRKVSEDYVRPGNIQPTFPSLPTTPKGNVNNSGTYIGSGDLGFDANEESKFVKLKLTLKNAGQKDCRFDFADVYISTEADSLYRFLAFQGYFIETKTRIKPQKEINRIVIFEIPDKSKVKELFIEDKRYKIIEN